MESRLSHCGSVVGRGGHRGPRVGRGDSAIDKTVPGLDFGLFKAVRGLPDSRVCLDLSCFSLA